jgi:SRSO17 transposase
MKTSKIMKSLAALLILSVVATTAFGGSQRVEQVVPIKGQPGYAYVWVTGSRIPQKVKISPIGTLTQSPLSEYDRRQLNWTRGGTARESLQNEPSLSFRGR